MKNIILMVFAMILFTQSIFANIDPFNTYRWNRQNVLNNTNEVQKGNWYEWWYYKVVIPETGESFFFVYGVVNPWDTNDTLKGTRAYVGMGDFVSKEQIEHIADIKDFNSEYEQTFVGDLKSEDGKKYSWDISIEKNWTFNATGWATGRNITNIEWYPAQADATCSGVIKSNGKVYNLVDTPCYQDRNWGSSFPKWWTWIVSNHFKGHPETSIAIGGGHPKYWNRNLPIKGVAVGLRHKGKVYQFRPNDFDKVKIDINFGKWEVLAHDGRYKLEIIASAPKESFMDLQFMTPTGEIFHDYETLTGELTVKIYERKGIIRTDWELKETLFSDMTGIEYGSKEVHDLFGMKNTLFSNF
jgi:tocopherol cyclase